MPTGAALENARGESRTFDKLFKKIFFRFRLNNCDIDNINRWVLQIKSCCPSITYLSLLGNPGATTMFNGSTVLEQNDYRMYVIGQLQTLNYLDDILVTETQRAQAKSQQYLIRLTSAFNFMDKFNRNQRIIRKNRTVIEIQNIMCTETDSS